MRTDSLEYPLEPSLIAQHPVEPRDAAKLLVAVGGEVSHRQVRDLGEFLLPGDLVVFNNTRVIPARVAVERRTGGAGEILLLEERSDGLWEALCRPSRKLAVGDTVHSTNGELRFVMGEDLGAGRRLVRPEVRDRDELLARLSTAGEMPLPPYIHERLVDPERYQTTFSRDARSAAAPTAGLHITEELLASLVLSGIRTAEVELVVGLDTFRPVVTDVLEDHEIHTERFAVPAETWEQCCATAAAGGRVVAVGTTTVRALESVAAKRSGSGAGDAREDRDSPLSGRTDLFITPGYRFAVVDLMLTNFHLPRSSLLALVEAFHGPAWRDLYAVAAREQYRFLSFGDAMLLDGARLPDGARLLDGAWRSQGGDQK